MLPNPNDPPSHLLIIFVDFKIAPPVLLDFWYPIVPIALRYSEMLRTTVPKARVDEYHCFPLSDDQIRISFEARRILSISYP